MTSRRGLLKLIGMAPIAAPVAAKEAAASMGLTGITGIVGVGANVANANYYRRGENAVQACDPIDWAKNGLKHLMSAERQMEIRMQAKNNARILDADIAAMRAVSPAAAYQMQIDRNVARIIDIERQWYQRSISSSLLGVST